MVESVTKTTLAQEAYRIVTDAILRCEFLPGHILSIENLADTLDISQTPIREALGRLASEGLVEQRSNKRLYVAGLTEEDIVDTYEVREVIEPYVAILAGKSIRSDPKTLALFRSLEADNSEIGRSISANGVLDPEQSELSIEIDLRLHDLIGQQIENSLLKDIWRLISNRSSRIRRYAEAIAKEGRCAISNSAPSEHAEIIAALLSGNPKRITAATREHLASAERRTLDALREIRGMDSFP
ncbi:GntR family transcriptional regulator [Candidatus Bipolaricaulota bacterium]